MTPLVGAATHQPMTTLPVKPVKPVPELAGKRNGALTADDMSPCGIGTFKMQHNAARGMRALVAAATAAGFHVRATGTYRSYEQQVQLFQSRYSTNPIEGRPTKVWEGRTYWQKPGTAMAAVPGTSNHGLGLAVDLAEERDGDAQAENISNAFVDWLCANAHRYGYSAEAQSEPWHWRWVAGGDIPVDVLAFEQLDPQHPTPVAQARPTLRRGSTGAAVREAQTLLTRRGFSTRGIDGVFGQYTEGSTKRFQAAHPACGPVDGVIGPRTWKVLAA